MRHNLRQFIIATPVLRPLRLLMEKWEISTWKKKGKPLPPPHVVKQIILREYARKFDLSILVETGTFMGNMVAAMMEDFATIYSIELSKELYEMAKKRFAGVEKVRLIHGDSGEELKKNVGLINKPALFWLDGHYSAGVTAKGKKDTPINEELETILKLPEKRHVIIVDDARLFGSDPAYPTLDELSEQVKSLRSDMQVIVEDDCIRIFPVIEEA